MKKLCVFLTLLLCGTISLVSAQNFSFTALDSVKQGVPNDCTGFYAEVHNLENFEVNFEVTMDTLLKPPEWVVSYCTGLYCYPPWVTSSEDQIAANGMDSLKVDFTPAASPDSGRVTMHVHPVNHLELDQSITFKVYLASGVPEGGPIPGAYRVLQAFPNPFNSALCLNFALDHPAEAELTIWDLQGNCVAKLFQGSAVVGQHRFMWNPGEMASGIYLARLTAGGTQQVQKVVYLR